MGFTLQPSGTETLADGTLRGEIIVSWTGDDVMFHEKAFMRDLYFGLLHAVDELADGFDAHRSSLIVVVEKNGTKAEHQLDMYTWHGFKDSFTAVPAMETFVTMFMCMK